MQWESCTSNTNLQSRRIQRWIHVCSHTVQCIHSESHTDTGEISFINNHCEVAIHPTNILIATIAASHVHEEEKGRVREV